MAIKNAKISIIGAGFVGSTTAYALMMSGLVSELVIVDVNKDKAKAEALDIAHGTPFVDSVKVIEGEYKDTKDSDIVIITAGAGPKTGETRLDVLNKNLSIFKSIVPNVVKYSPNSILLVVSNPVDILTHITYKLSGFPKERVIGSGTVLDSSRFKYILGQEYDMNPRDLNTYIIGEHGDSQIAAWSLTTVSGMNIETYLEKNENGLDTEKKIEIAENVKKAGFDIVSGKGYTNYGVALAVRRIVEAILRDEETILPVSILLEGEYDIEDVYLGIPSVIGASGVKRVLEVPLAEEEIEGLKKSAEFLKESLEKIAV